MRQVVITQELVDNYPYKNSKWSPSRPYCRLCAVLVVRGKRTYMGLQKKGKLHVHIFKIGEKAIEVTFRNGKVAYYSPSCWNDPLNKLKVKNIKSQEKANSSEMPSHVETYP